MLRFARLLLASSWVATGLLTACVPSQSGKVQAVPPRTNARPPPTAPEEPVPGLRSSLVTEVPAGTFGPYMGVARDGKLLIWAQPVAEGQALTSAHEPELSDSELGDGEEVGNAELSDGEPAERPEDDVSYAWYSAGATLSRRSVGEAEPAAPQVRRLLQAPAGMALAAVKPAPGGAGHLVVGTASDAEGQRVEVFAVGLGGELRASPVALARGLGEVLWIEAVSTGTHTLVLWAERDGKVARVSAATLDANLQPSSSPQRLVSGAQAWQAQGFQGGAALAYVAGPVGTQSGETNGEVTRGGTVHLVLLDEQGQRVSDQLVSAEPSAGRDLDAVVTDSQVLLAWSDARRLESRIYTAAVRLDGQLSVAPVQAVPALSPQVLLRLLPPYANGMPAYLVWEEPLLQSTQRRRFFLSPLGPDAKAMVQRGELGYARASGGLPELATTADGVAAVTLASRCQIDTRGCAEPPLPAFVKFDAALSVQGTAPIQLQAASGRYADFAWGLHCQDSGCSALGARASDPAPIYEVELSALDAQWRSPASVYQQTPPPRAENVQSIVDTEPLSGVALTRVGEQRMAAWLTYFDPAIPYEKPSEPAPDGRLAPVRALLEVGLLSDRGELTERRVVSYRARSGSGLALATHADTQRSLLVWSALDDGRSEVFLTLLDARGEKIAQRMLTHARAEVTSVAVAPLDDGFAVGWIDDRSGQPEVYAAKVDFQLARRSAEQHVSETGGAAADLQALAAGGRVWLTYAGTSDLTSEARDLSLVSLDANLARVSDRLHFDTGNTHGRGPVLAHTSQGLVLGWVQDPVDPAGAALINGGEQLVALRLLDPEGKQLGSTEVSFTGLGAAFDLECEAEQCRGVVTSAQPARPWVHVFSWNYGEKPVQHPALPLLGGDPEDPQHLVPPVLDRGLVLLGDFAEQRGRVRVLDVSWE